MAQYGLVFKDDNDDIWLGRYENGTIREFNPLSDFEGIYNELATSKLAFVEVKDDENKRIWINDICKFEVGKQNEDSNNEIAIVSVEDMLKEFNFPSEDSDSMFGSFLVSAGKTN